MEVVRELLDRGAAIDAATKKGNTALHIASLAGQEAVVKLLVQTQAQVSKRLELPLLVAHVWMFQYYPFTLNN